MKDLFNYLCVSYLLIGPNPLFSQSEPCKDSMILYTNSLGDFVSENAHKIVSKCWPFSIESKSGNLLDEFINQEIEEHNDKVWKSIDSIGFEKNKQKYYSEVKEEAAKIRMALGLIDESPNVIELLNKLKKTNRSSFTRLTKIKENQYLFEVFSFELIEIQNGEQIEIRLIADINKNTVRVMDD